MSQIIAILNFEEGFKAAPYIDSEGFPTVGTGFKIGPKGAPLSNYTFTIPQQVNDVWLQNLVDTTLAKMNATPAILAAMKQCNAARRDILTSMAYQMGVGGLAAFKNTLAMIEAGNFTGASSGMLASLWAKQTPKRASRHAEVMRTGDMTAYAGLLK